MKRFALFFTLLALTVSAQATETVYQGESTLWTDTVWSDTVLIDGIVTVAPNITLTIQPGTTIRFTRNDTNGDDIGENELFIQGRLLAQGRRDAPILFTSAADHPRPGDWGALNMMASQEGNRIEFCRVEYAYRGFHAHFAGAQLVDSIFRFNRRGAQFQESQVSIERCRFEQNLNGLQFRDSTVTLRDSVISGGYWGLRSVYSTVTMSGNRIEKNRINGVNFRDSTLDMTANQIVDNRRGLYLQRSTGRVDRNVLSGNSEYGLFLEAGEVVVQGNRINGNGRGGLRVIDANLDLVGNDLSGNDLYALVNDGSSNLIITGNAWGTVDPALLAGLIRDGADRSGCGQVQLLNPLAPSTHPEFVNPR
jgi:hypothetical protein